MFPYFYLNGCGFQPVITYTQGGTEEHVHPVPRVLLQSPHESCQGKTTVYDVALKTVIVYNCWFAFLQDNIRHNRSMENDDTYYLWSLRFGHFHHTRTCTHTHTHARTHTHTHTHTHMSHSHIHATHSMYSGFFYRFFMEFCRCHDFRVDIVGYVHVHGNTCA